MVRAAEAVERQFCSPEQIFNAIDYWTKCGVGSAAPVTLRMDVDSVLTDLSSTPVIETKVFVQPTTEYKTPQFRCRQRSPSAC